MTAASARHMANWVLGAILVACLYDLLSGSGGIIPSPSPPSPKPGSWVIVIEESSERSQQLARLVASDWPTSLESRQLRFRIYDIDQDEARGYATHARQAGLPAVLVVDTSGQLLASFRLPSDRTALDAAIKEATGL